MKCFICQILFLLLFSTCLLAQNNQGNFRSAIDITEDGFMSTWQESTNLSDKLTIIVELDFPTEFGFYLGQSRLEYQTLTLFTRVDVRYDNGSWITLLNGVSYTTGEFIPPWNSEGAHTMDIKYWDMSGISNTINQIVFVIPPRDKVYYDGLGNWVSGWTGTTPEIDRPVIIIEGFDPMNLTWPDYYYGKAANWLNRIRGLHADVLIFNFNEGGVDLVANAHLIQGFTRYIESITQGAEKIILAGLSMGGPIGRYALAEADAQGIPLYVSHFLSIDSPQQDAIIPRDFLDYIKDNDEGTPHPELNSVAAKQMLRYDPYDSNSPGDNSMHKIFYNVLDNLNGDGYPHNCINIGVSFAPNITNPNLGEWLEVDIDLVENQHFYLWEDNECLTPGSYLPLRATVTQGSTFFGFIHWNLVRKKNPTYIPYVSALDIVNGESKFDVTLNSSAIHYHDEFPDDLVDPVSAQIGLLEDSYTNVTFRNVFDNTQEDDASGLLKVTDNSGAESQISSGGIVSVSTNNDNIVETLDRYRLNFYGNGINYQQNNWNHVLSDYKVKHTFQGWEYNGNQKTFFSKLDKISVKNLLLEVNSTAGNIEFKDPWYKIGENQPNIFQTFSSPFTPGEGTYASYGGVFLNQDYNIPSNPYYSVNSPDMQPITVNGQTHKFFLLNWSGTDAEFEDENSSETGVVFTSENATVTANLKGTQLSNYSGAYNNDGQRKFLRTPDGRLHLTYESLNTVWYEMSEDNGQTWQIIGSNFNTNGWSSHQPSLSYYQDGADKIHVFMYYRLLRGEPNDWLQFQEYIYDSSPNPEIYESENLSPSNPIGGFTYTNPIIACAENGKILFVWESSLNGVGQKLIYSYGKKLSNGYWEWYDTGTLEFTNNGAKNPTVVASQNLNDLKFHLAWNEGYEVYYTALYPDASNHMLNTGKQWVSNGSGYPYNNKPSIIEMSNLARISWIGL